MIPAQDFVFIDEMGAALNMTWEYGRAPRSQWVYCEKPTAHQERISTIGAMTSQGIQTALCFEGTLNTWVFLHFVKHFLCRVLRPGQVVVMDNATAHKGAQVRALIESKGAKVLYLPPYSPEFNPIELAWSKVKAYLKFVKARCKESLYMAIDRGLDLVSAQNASA